MGSEWRRWDLHVHTPETALEDAYEGGWNTFLAAIEAQTQVVVIGVTDYFCISNYSKMRKLRTEGRIRNIVLLLPNIEFRITPRTRDGHAVNIHLVVSPDDPSHENLILQALGRLQWKYGDHNYSCLPEQLISLGRAYDANATSDTSALRVGATQFKVDFSQFKKWYEDETWLRKHSMVIVAAGEDGLSGLSKDSGWAATRDELCRFADAIFSGRPGEREFWLGAKSEENRKEIEKLGGPKPCLHGSDAHNLARLFKPAENRFCWIKADPTYEGLRQCLFEPESRVHIDLTPPEYHDRARVLTAVTTSDSNGWFEDSKLPLNSNLISVIGAKGSGKSALADVIAFAAGSFSEDDSAAFLNRAREHLVTLKIKLEWADGGSSEVRLNENQPDTHEVRYLSQSFVERLCSQDYGGDELVHEIEVVIFSHLDPSDTLNASDFAELRAMRTEHTRAQRGEVKARMEKLIREDRELRGNRLTVPEKRQRLAALEKESDGLQKQIPAAQNAEEAKIQEQLLKSRNNLIVLQAAAARDKQLLLKIASIAARVASFSKEIDRFNVDLQAALMEVGLPAEENQAFRVEFRADLTGALKKRVTAIDKKIADREGNADDPPVGTIARITRDISSLEMKATADLVRRTRLQAIQRRILAVSSESERIKQEIANIEGPQKERLASLRSERLDTYLEYFTSLKEEQQVLEALYRPVKARLDAGTEQEQSLAFSIRWEIELNKWLDRCLALFDQRKAFPFGSIQVLEAEVRKALVPGWIAGDLAQIRVGMEAFLESLNTKNAAASLRSAVTLSDLLTWAMDIEHIQLRYALRYNGVELEKLSPGIKGIVLLILYLGVDRDDTRPLIVDQPEENLDNESIYNLLAGYFRRAKKERQFILITHNPNLVVNTDSEQVIVAQATRRKGGLPTITYVSGSLENTTPLKPGIRQHVCRILEGGETAFKRREQRYGLHP